MAAKDRRIIEMQFENKQFEKNIAKSTKSVDDLKKAMDFEQVSSGLKKFADGFKNIDLSRLTDNIQKLTDKFTGLGTLSELVLSQIRRSIEQVASKISGFVSSMTTAQVSAGMDKYEMLNKSVQTIKAATGRDEKEVYEVLKRLNQYTDQTSYNFSDMASNIGKFTSVGIPLEAAERQMEGIANWAARSGAGINEASRAMYNLSQAMGVGKLTKIDWKSIENAGMATKEFKEQLIQAGIEAGTLKKKGDKVFTAKGNVEVNYKNVADTLAKGWATSGVISSTLEKYYYDDLYYENETEAILKLDDTQKKSFDSMVESGKKLDKAEWKALKDMGVITDETKQKIIDMAVGQGKLTKSVDKDGKTIYKAVDKTGKEIEYTFDNIEESLSSGWFDKSFAEAATSVNELAKASYESAQKCMTFADVLGAWRDQISTGWMTSFTYIFGELSEAMEFFSKVCNRVGDAIGELIDLRNGVLASWSNAGGRNTLMDIILGDYEKDTETGAVGFLDLLEGVKDLLMDGLIDFFGLFGDDFDKMMMKKDPKYFQSFLGKQLNGITQGIEDFLKKIKNFFNAEINVNGKTKTRLEVIHDVVDGIAGALKIAWDILTKAIEFFGDLGKDLSPGLDKLLGFFGDLGKSIFDTSKEVSDENGIKKWFNDLRETVKPLTDSLNDLLSSISDLLRSIFGLDKEGATQTDTLKKIGSVIRSIADIITKIASPVIKFFSRIIDLVRDLFKDGINAESIKKFGAGLGDAFGEMMKTFADHLPDSLGFVKDWIHKVFGGGTEEIQKESNSLFSKLLGVNKKAEETQKEAEANASNGPGILGLLTGTNVAVWVGVAALVGVVLLIRKARKVLGSIGDFFGSLSDTLKDGFKVKFQDESFANKFLKIGAAIALVAGSIIALGSIPLESLIQGGIAVVVVAGIMFGLFKLLQKSAEKGSFKDQMAFAAQVTALAFGMIALSVAIGILTLALIPFTLMSWEQYAKAMAGLGGILLQMVAFMGLIKLLKIDSVKIAGFAGFAIGLGMLVQGIAPFAKMSWGQYAKAMAGLGGVLLQMVAFMKLMDVLKIKDSKLAGFVGFALSLAILVMAIRPFANMSWEQYGKAMAGLGGILIQMLVFMGIMKLMNTNTKQMKSFIGFALSLAILVFAIKPFVSMSWEQYGKAMAGLGGILIEMLVFMGIMKLMDTNTKQMKSFIGFALSLVIIIQAIMPFTNMSWEQYAKAMAGLGGVLIEMLIFMGLMKLFDSSTKQMTGFLLFVFSLKLLIDSIMPFTQMSWDQYAKAMAGLGGILLELIAFMALLKLLDFEKDILAIAGAFPTLAFGIQALVNAILPFKDMDWDQYAKTMAGLGGILLIMLGFMAILKLVKPDIKNMLKVAVFAGIFAAVAGVFAYVLTMVKDIDWKTITAFTAGLAVMLVSMGIAAAIAGAIGIKGFAILAIGVALVMGAIALMAPVLIGSIMTALRNAASDLQMIGELMKMFSITMGEVDESGLDKAKRLFEKMMEILSTVAGVVFTSDDTKEFMMAMSKLTLAGDEIIKFDSKIKSMSFDGGTQKAKYIIAMFKDILQNDLAGFGEYTSATDSFYTAVFNLGSAFDYFDSMTSDIGSADENQGLQLIKQLAACAPDLDTIYKMDLDKLKTQLAELGGAMIIYAQGAAKVNGGEITEDTDVGGAITLLKKISESLASEGGFAIPDNMPTDKELTNFGVQLAALAGALVAFEKAGSKLGDGTKEAIKTLDFFYDLKTKLKESEGFGTDLTTAIDSFKGEGGEMIKPSELTQFGEDIAKLGSAMAHFASSTQVVDETTGEVKPIDFSLATEALQSIADLSTKLPSVGGVMDVITGTKKDLSDLAPEINLLGDALNEFYQKTTIFDEANKVAKPMDFANTITMLNSLGDLSTQLNMVKINGFNLDSLFVRQGMSLSDLGAQLSQLGIGMGTFGEQIAGKFQNVDDINNALLALNGLINLLINLARIAETTYLDPADYALGLNKFLTQLVNGITTVDSEGNEVTKWYDSLSLLVEVMQWISAELDKFPEIKIDNLEKFNLLTEALGHLTGINLRNTADFEYVGLKIAEGFATGMKNGASIVTQAAEDLALDAYTAALKKLGIQSPSRAFMEIGNYVGLGFAKGMTNSSTAVVDSATDMSEEALDSTKNIIALISSVMAEDISANPTITPILDMTNLTDGMNDFKDSLTGYGVKLDTSFSASRASQASSSNYQDVYGKPDYSGIYEKMNQLGKEISNMSQTISKMKIVLSTGELVGALSDRIDDDFGRKGFYESRNN